MALTRETVLQAAQDVVKRHGAAKATVVDVAQALGVSHGSIYRFFPTKAALREAVVGAWLDRTLTAVSAHRFEGPAPTRLRAWFDAFMSVKRAQRAESPELFAAFRELSRDEPHAIAAYKAQLAGQVAALLAEGVAAGEFEAPEPEATARALLTATMRYHHPAFESDWNRPLSDDFETLWTLLIRSITPERKSF